jgi:hypothetical protein
MTADRGRQTAVKDQRTKTKDQRKRYEVVGSVKHGKQTQKHDITRNDQ